MKMQQLEELKQFEEDMNWITAHYEELKRRYPEEYVAVYGYVVVDHDREIKQLMERMRKRYGRLASSVAVEYIATKKDELIL